MVIHPEYITCVTFAFLNVVHGTSEGRRMSVRPFPHYNSLHAAVACDYGARSRLLVPATVGKKNA